MQAPNERLRAIPVFILLLIVVPVYLMPLGLLQQSLHYVQTPVMGYLNSELLSGIIPDVATRAVQQIPSGASSFAGPIQTLNSTVTGFETSKEVSVEHFTSTLVPQNEPSVAVSPINASNIVVGYHDRFPTPTSFVCSFSFSGDAGASWTFGGVTRLATTTDFCSDPSLAADASGNFYYSYLSVRSDVSTSDVLVAKSSDGGRTFSTFQFAAFGARRISFPDKEWIAVDRSPTSPFKGTVYVAYTDFHNGGDGQITLVSSRNFTLGFSTPIRISVNALSPEVISGSMPIVAPDGTLYVAYADFIVDTGPLAIRVAKVTGGGTTLAGTFTVAANLPSPGGFRLRNADPNFGVVSGAGFRASSFPTGAVSPEGNLYLAWVQFPSLSNCRNDGSGRPPCFNGNVFFSRSSAGAGLGASWSAPVMVNDQSVLDHFFPSLSTRSDGTVELIFGDKRLDPNNIMYDVFYTSSSDAGTTFVSPNLRVTDVSSNPGTETFIGDYFGLASTPFRAHAVWTDRRNGNDDIFASRNLTHDIAVTSAVVVLQPGKTHEYLGNPIPVKASLADVGSFPENFSVVLLANGTRVAAQTVSLASGASYVVALSWNTTGFRKGVYDLVVIAGPVPGEVEVADNSLAAGRLGLTCFGDVDGDFKVTVSDVLLAVAAWGSTPGSLNWNPNADFDNDNSVALNDVLRAIAAWGHPC